jgi:hypothetical protein
MNWFHILDKQPKHGDLIVHIFPPYEGHWCLGMRKYDQSGSFEELLHFYKAHDLEPPDFWWVLASDFPFPDQNPKVNNVS